MVITTNTSIYSSVSTTQTTNSTQNTNSSFNALVNTQSQDTPTTSSTNNKVYKKINDFLDAHNGYSSLSPTDEKIFRDILSDNKLTKEEADSLSYEQVERIAILLRQSDLPEEEWKSMPIVERGVDLSATTKTGNKQFNEAHDNYKIAQKKYKEINNAEYKNPILGVLLPTQKKFNEELRNLKFHNERPELNINIKTNSFENPVINFLNEESKKITSWKI